MRSIVNTILKIPLIGNGILHIRKLQNDWTLYRDTKKRILSVNNDANIIYYLGVPAHNNLGDLAQGLCIRKWIRKHYPQYTLMEIETNTLVNTPFSLLLTLKKMYKPTDFIVFQSGYTTTDLGGFADEMHRAVIQVLPNARMLMMPQTIFFQHEKNKVRTSEVYNSAKNMLFLARDRVSYEMACEMFPDLTVKLFPDIVTILIGNDCYNYKRNGILFCLRDDGEKYYSNKEISTLMNNCKEFCKVNKTDTTKHMKHRYVVGHAKELIWTEIEQYSQYKVLITDRYHGTILSLIAGTPVIILRTTDHKVITGAEWFRGVYDDYVYVADNLDEAYQLAKRLYQKELRNKLNPYFENHFYDKLPEILLEKWGD